MRLLIFKGLFVLFTVTRPSNVVTLRRSFQLPGSSARDPGYEHSEATNKLEELLDRKLSPLQNELKKIEEILNIDGNSSNQSIDEQHPVALAEDSSTSNLSNRDNTEETAAFKDESQNALYDNAISNTPRFTALGSGISRSISPGGSITNSPESYAMPYTGAFPFSNTPTYAWGPSSPLMMQPSLPYPTMLYQRDLPSRIYPYPPKYTAVNSNPIQDIPQQYSYYEPGGA